MSEFDANNPKNQFPSNAYRKYATESHYGPEVRQSGNLPGQPVGLEVDAAPDNATPWKKLTTGR